MPVFGSYKTKFTESGERKIGFKPNYIPLLDRNEITATVRVVFDSSPYLRIGQSLLLLSKGMAPRHAVVTRYGRAPFGNVAVSDLRGCSPDFGTVAAARVSLGGHFKRAIHDSTVVEIIRFRYVDAPSVTCRDRRTLDQRSLDDEYFGEARSSEALFGLDRS